MDPADVLRMLEGFEQRYHEKEGQAVPKGGQEEGRSDFQGVLVAPPAEVWQEARRPHHIGFVFVSEGGPQPILLTSHRRIKDDERDDHEQARHQDGTGLRPHAEGADEAEDVERIPTDRIRSSVHDLRLLSPTDIKRAPGPSDDTDEDESQTEGFEPFMKALCVACRMCDRSESADTDYAGC